MTAGDDGTEPRPVLDPAEVEVLYDWPVGGEHPFDLSADETRWVLYARAWGRAWAPGTWGDFGNLVSDFPVPMGYKQLMALERLAVCAEGRVLREWPETGLRSFDGRELGYAAFIGCDLYESDVRRPWRRWTRVSFRQAKAEGLNLSEEVGLVMVGRLVADQGWH